MRLNRIWEDRLPTAGSEISRVVRQQIMQESSSAARQPEHEYGPVYALLENRGIFFLLLPKPEQIGQETQHVPSHRDPAEGAKIRFFIVRPEKYRERLLERPFPEIVETRSATGQLDQLFGRYRPSK